jgi:hypothetical protein
VKPPLAPPAEGSLFHAFGAGWEIDAEEFPEEFRRRTPLRFGAARPVPLAAAASDPLAVVAGEAAALLQIHPGQSPAGREGALQFLAEHQALLQGLAGFAAFGLPAFSRAEALARLGAGFPNGVVRVALRAEAVAGAVAFEEAGDPARLAGPGQALLLSAAVVEELGAGISRFIDPARRAGARLGAGFIDPRALAAGLSPAALGFDFALLDTAPLLGADGCILSLFDGDALPAESANADRPGEWLPFLERLLRLDLRLRALGGGGLAALARDAAVRTAYLQARLRREAPARWRGGSLFETWMAGEPPLVLDGTEPRAELDRLIAAIAATDAFPFAT